jgi:coenzyme F420-reducing hydrogenase alpha subunit
MSVAGWNGSEAATMANLVLQPLTRVEGHGRVELHLSDGRLQEVRLALVESPRLFEKLVVGRAAAEVPELVCRICAICSAVHKLAALTAIERALAIEIPPAAQLVRELLLLGGHIQSHALHLFCLILPDFTAQASIFDRLRAGDPLAARGIELKAFGNQLQEVAGGRVIHPVNPLLGGVARCPSAAELAELRRACDHWCQSWPPLAAAFATGASYPAARPPIGTLLATGASDREALCGRQLFLAGGETVPVEAYAGLLAEARVGYSRAKQATGQRGPFLVGALARQQLWRERSGAAPLPVLAGIHANNAAQADEIDWALKRVAAILAELQRLPADTPLRTAPGPVRGGVGTAAFEAPRGLLIHRYVVDDWGQVAAADIVTPTAINQRAMERQLFADLARVDAEPALGNCAERIVRAYDPCISCAVHIIQR